MCVEEAMYSGDTPAPRISRSWGATLSVFQPFWVYKQPILPVACITAMLLLETAPLQATCCNPCSSLFLSASFMLQV